MASQPKPATPGDFSITELSIQTFAGQVYDVLDKQMMVEIYESIYSPSLDCVITFLDSVGMLETLPIIGEEKIFLTFYTATPERSIRRIFYSYKIEEIQDNAQQSTTFRLRCCSPESVLNTRLRVYNSYGPMPYSQMAKSIYFEYFERELQTIFSPEYSKSFNVEDTKESYVIAVPGMHPFDAMNMLARRSITLVDNRIPGSLFFFWETLHGHYFRSIETIMKRYQELVEEGNLTDIPSFMVRPKNLQDEDRPELPMNEADFGTIDDFEHKTYFNTLKNMEEGMYSRKLVGHNIWDMKVEQHEFFYDKDGFAQGHLKKNSILASTKSIGLAPPNAEKKGAAHNKFAHVEYYPLSGSTFYNNAGKWRLNRGSQIEQLQSMVLNITIPGDDRVECGTCIDLDLPSRVPFTTQKEVLRSGGYLVTRIHHQFFKGDYRMKLECAKDSYDMQLNKIIEEPNMMQQLHPVTLKPLPANESSTPSTIPGRAKDINSDETGADPKIYRIYSYASDRDTIPSGPRVKEVQSSAQKLAEAQNAKKEQ